MLTIRRGSGSAFVITARCELVNVRDDPAGAAVVVADAQGERAARTLDTGAIDRASLALRGARVYRTNAGERRTALLR